MIDSYLSRIYREAIELDKNSFSKGEKTHRNECNQTSYSTKDSNNMLSSKKTSLKKKKMQSIYRSKTHTHTHTKKLNKSNQFYNLKISQDNLVSIH